MVDTLLNETLLMNGTNGSLDNSLNGTMSIHEQSSQCLPSWVLNAIGVKSVYASDIAVAIVNISFAISAFLSNLAVIATIIRTPSLHAPVNVLLCGLAAADCLTGLVVQPVYASWRFLLHHLGEPCRLVPLYQASMAKIVVSAWVVWIIYICLMETVIPKAIYKPMENITLTSLIIIPVGGHILTFLAIRTNNRKILCATHNLQHATLYKRALKAARDITFYIVTTLLSLVPLVIFLNFENSVIVGNLLFPWAATATMLVSSVNPVIQIRRNTALREALKTVFKRTTVE
ncbi:hypothetical protein OS493_036702 [Desmophyllum pertusum]|uniref:G-protein coupled receptors family 1 profile domain-containing protein n=1 Tax=Desmophyllum pertusum TaxID=174260 RepID=A0A9X0D007_9CNID|nr:hypothetical protein OS493_036702 [Desmophyllum pertusum]